MLPRLIMAQVPFDFDCHGLNGETNNTSGTDMFFLQTLLRQLPLLTTAFCTLAEMGLDAAVKGASPSPPLLISQAEGSADASLHFPGHTE